MLYVLQTQIRGALYNFYIVVSVSAWQRDQSYLNAAAAALPKSPTTELYAVKCKNTPKIPYKWPILHQHRLGERSVSLGWNYGGLMYLSCYRARLIRSYLVAFQSNGFLCSLSVTLLQVNELRLRLLLPFDLGCWTVWIVNTATEWSVAGVCALRTHRLWTGWQAAVCLLLLCILSQCYSYRTYSTYCTKRLYDTLIIFSSFDVLVRRKFSPVCVWRFY